MSMIQNQTITINNRNSGEHRTFRIKLVQGGAIKGKQILELLIGQDNESDYQAFAFISDAGAQVWKRYKEPGKGSIWQVYAAMIEQHLGLREHGFTFNQIEFLSSRRCMRCNRTLTTPESIERGIGPECAEKWGGGL